jgi:uncharacterized protein (DUF488 family)
VSTGIEVFTIGHSNHEEVFFLDLLSAHGITLLVDVRSSPYSKYTPHFSKENLDVALKKRGVRYLFLGDELGGRPASTLYYDASGYVRYDRLAKSKLFQAGIEHVLQEASANRAALLCGEEDPGGCHRRLLVGKVLLDHGVTLFHIRGDGSLQTEEELRRCEAGEKRERSHGQMSLFEFEEEPEWKSIRSVSPKRPPENSLGS